MIFDREVATFFILLALVAFLTLWLLSLTGVIA